MKENEQKRPDRHKIYNAVINRMVREGLEKKESAFAFLYRNASDEELLIYLRKCAAELEHSPWPKEIVGWTCIMERFGDWQTALRRAHLPQPRTPNKPSTFRLVIEETEIQKQIYRQNQAEKKVKSAQRRAAQERKQKAKEKKQTSAPPLREVCGKEAV